MKSLTAVCQTGASMPAINPNGRINRHPPHRGDGENAEMKMYLSKLKDLVPFMPKNRKLSKLEIIQHVIDYICDLQSELETHPEINNFDASAALSFAASSLEHADASGSSASNDSISDPYENADADMAAAADDEIQQRLNPQQSSPAQRQPLVDRQTPNTILPTANSQQQQQLQRQMTNSLQNHHSSTVTDSSSSSSASSSGPSTHALSDEKSLDSRQLC
ncbi:basic helix-loop-helix domain-containing extra-macrochaetae [Haematobia irritans]|uniref:basic helix-loop-helix domain-containing extra-macrochaetae n=1 Tax=Haematobia irritans TaxID=7368 RepID=UPI003F4FEA01